MTGSRPANPRSSGMPPFLMAVLAMGALAWIATRPPREEATARVGPAPAVSAPAPPPAKPQPKKPEPDRPRDLAGARRFVEAARLALERGDLAAARAAADRALRVAGGSFPELDEFAVRLTYHEEMRTAGQEARERASAHRAEGRLQAAIDALKHHLFVYPLSPDRPEIDAEIERLVRERKGRFDIDLKKLQILGEGGSLDKARELVAQIALYASPEEIRAAEERLRALPKATGKAPPAPGAAKGEPAPEGKAETVAEKEAAEKEPEEKEPAGEEPREKPAGAPDAQALAREIRQYLASVSEANQQRFRQGDLDAQITLIPDAFADRVAREALAALDDGARPDELPARLAKIRREADSLRGSLAVEIR
ncbi:MAG: hypothetical protein JXP34_11170, partial [Planctomycetes bacterium]|nr:hypothetical protein [Planctomycetota bacterium]